MSRPLNLVVIISGNGSNLQSIIDAIECGQVNAQISAVISNNPDAFGLSRAKKHGLVQQVVDHHCFDGREAFDQSLLETVNRYRPDFIILAGFMRILGSAFIQAYKDKILNIHPSILPDYKGLNTHQRAIDNRETEHGVSIHLVTEGLDDGPVLLRGRYPVAAQDTVEDLQRKGHALEHQMYPRLIQWLCDDELKIRPDEITFKQQLLCQPIEFNHV